LVLVRPAKIEKKMFDVQIFLFFYETSESEKVNEE